MPKQDQTLQRLRDFGKQIEAAAKADLLMIRKRVAEIDALIAAEFPDPTNSTY